MAAILRVALKMILAEFGRHGERGTVAPYDGVSGERRCDLSLLSSSLSSMVLRVYREALHDVESCWGTRRLFIAVAGNNGVDNYVSSLLFSELVVRIGSKL